MNDRSSRSHSVFTILLTQAKVKIEKDVGKGGKRGGREGVEEEGEREREERLSGRECV